MLVAYLLTFLFYSTGQCQNLMATTQQEEFQEVTECIIDILDKYFSERKDLTYVNMNPDNDALLKAIHSKMNLSLVTRLSNQQVLIPNKGYLVLSENVTHFIEYFPYLIREGTWNPYARFLIVVGLIQDNQLIQIFNQLLRQHVINAVVLNASDGNLYSYNPFDKYACGRYYNTVISYGPCSECAIDLYPNKLVTGLKNCQFRACLAHHPPYSINPLLVEDKKTFLGTEEYIIRLLGALEQFTVSFKYTYNEDEFSTVEPNMTATGSLSMLQKNECDIIFGGMMIVAPRAEAFTFLSGYHDYSDELRFAVKISSLIPTWTYVYLEFEYDVWILLLVVIVIFSILMIILLRSKDGSRVVLRLLDNLLLHGRHVRTRFALKCILISWVWFSYLLNTFYQTILFSFTMQPIMRFQVSDEEDMIEYDFQPCFSQDIQQYLFSEDNNLTHTFYFMNEGCQTTAIAMDTISVTEDVFTLVPSYFYLYNKQKYTDRWGNSLVYYFEKPFTKLLFGYIFYKGFPISRRLQLNALHIRESGLVDKNLHDHYYAQKLKQKLTERPFKPMFLLPWCIYIPGLVLATIAFMIELLMQLCVS